MKYEKDLVSVIIPTYKRADKLERAIYSVLNQTYSNIEVLVVSDNEPDDVFSMQAQKVVDSFCDNRVSLLLQDHHKNGAAARNYGIKNAKGEFLAFLDDDDWWEKKKLEYQVEQLKQLDESWGAVTCKNKSYINGKLRAALPKFKDGWICKGILSRLVDVSTDAILLRHEALDSVGMFDEQLLRHQEVQLMAFFSEKYKIKLLNMYLVGVDSSVNENQPNPQKMEKIKLQFLKSVKPILDRMNNTDRKDIYNMHKFELGLLYLRSNEKKKGFLLCCNVLRSLSSLWLSFCYIYKKIGSRLFASKRVEKDNRKHQLSL